MVLTGVAQWYERPTFNRVVEGSIPSISIIRLDVGSPSKPSYLRRKGFTLLSPKVDESVG